MYIFACIEFCTDIVVEYEFGHFSRSRVQMHIQRRLNVHMLIESISVKSCDTIFTKIVVKLKENTKYIHEQETKSLNILKI